MRKISIIFLTIVGLISLLSGCKKDETRAVLSDNPVLPTIATVPNLTFVRANGADSIAFVCTPINPGFAASTTYYLEADTAGDQFQNPVVLVSDLQDAKFTFSVSDLNGIFIKRFPTDTSFSVDLRIRAVLQDDAASVNVPLSYSSATKTASVTTYGLPRLDLLGSGINQKIESPLGDGNYSGYVKLDASKPFTLRDPDAGVSYGDNGGALGVDGTAISVAANGWYQVAASTGALTYSVKPYFVGLVGDATPNGWNSPDEKMDYDAKTGTWSITLALVTGNIKFRLNDDWGWNLGGTTSNLTQNGANIPVNAGNYTITLSINSDGQTGTFTIVQH